MRFAVFLFIIQFSILGHSKLISAAIGQVGSTVVTTREVQIAGIMEGWLLIQAMPAADRKKINRESWVLKLGTDAFQKMTNQVILTHMVNLEAENFSVAQISPEEVKKICDSIQEDLRSWNEWKKLDVTPSDLEQQVSRHLRSKAFLKFKTESTGVQATEAEARSYYEKNRVKFGNLPFEKFKSGIEAYLSQKQLEERLKDWFETLKRKYHVRMIRIQNEFDSNN